MRCVEEIQLTTMTIEVESTMSVHNRKSKFISWTQSWNSSK